MMIKAYFDQNMLSFSEMSLSLSTMLIINKAQKFKILDDWQNYV